MSGEVEQKPVVIEEELTKKEEEVRKDAGDAPQSAEEKGAKEEEAKKEEAAAPPPPPPPRVHKTDFEKDTVYLFQFCRTPVLPSLSPYCLKVESFLRLNGIKYENVDHKMKWRSAKGQLPFVELNGEEICDSQVIINKLSQHFGVELDANLSKEEKNASHALMSMIENHLCWVYVYWRSKNPDAMIKGCKLSLQNALGSRIPNFLLTMIFKLTYSRKGAKKVKAHGMGLHSAEEVLEFGKQDLQVLEDSIGNKDYFFGDKPSTLDLVAFAHLSQIAYIDPSVEYEMQTWMTQNCPNLMGFLARMKERCFPDWDDICSSLKLNTHLPEEKEAEKPEKEPVKEKEAEKEPKEKGDEIKPEEEKKEEVKEEETK